MPTIAIEINSISHVPNLHCFISSTRSDTLAIGRPCHSIHLIWMDSVGEGVTAISSIPDLHGTIGGSGGNAFAIGGPSYSVYCPGMPCIGIAKLRIGWR